MKLLRSAAGLVLVGVCSGAPASRAVDWTAVGQEAAELLSGYVRIDTSNPPGNEHAAAVYLKRFFDAEGIQAQLFTSAPGRSAVVARLPADRPDPAGRGPILLLSHSDVVPADPRAWPFPPFSGAIEDGVIYGRGTLDDKGHGVAQALGLALLHRSGAARARDIVLCASPAEETEGENVGVEWLIENHWEALGPPVGVWNEGGVSTRNAVLGERVVNAIATSEKRALWITLVAEGEGGHGSQPDAAGAIEVLTAALARVRDFDIPAHATGTVRETFSRVASAAPFPQSLVLRFAGNPLGIRLVEWALRKDRVMRATIHDTIALTELRAGLKHNVIPRRAEASLDVRLLPDTDAEVFLEALRRVIADPRVRIEDVPDPLPPTTTPSPTDHELFRAIEAEMARELPDSLTIPLQTTGGSDSKFFRKVGVPSYGYLPAVISGERVASIHGLDERIPADELQRAVRVTYRVLRRLVE